MASNYGPCRARKGHLPTIELHILWAITLQVYCQASVLSDIYVISDLEEMLAKFSSADENTCL